MTSNRSVSLDEVKLCSRLGSKLLGVIARPLEPRPSRAWSPEMSGDLVGAGQLVTIAQSQARAQMEPDFGFPSVQSEIYSVH